MATWVTDLFATVDRMDADKFVSFLTEDASFRFGNAQAVVGRAGISQAVAGFFGTIAGLRHRILNEWQIGGSVVIEIEVTYTRKDGKKVTIPCVNIFEMAKDKIRDYKIFIDLAPLYA